MTFFVNGEYSQMFPCEEGVREGEWLSSINDLYRYLDERSNNMPGIEYECDEVTYYFKIFLLMYADDTTLLSESNKGLQETIKHLYRLL